MSEIMTTVGKPVESGLLTNYFDNLVNGIFKILPMWEKGEATLPVYIRGLQSELLGCGELTPTVKENAQYLSLLSILEHLRGGESERAQVRRDVFRAISLCNKLSALYGGKEGAR